MIRYILPSIFMTAISITTFAHDDSTFRMTVQEGCSTELCSTSGSCSTPSIETKELKGIAHVNSENSGKNRFADIYTPYEGQEVRLDYGPATNITGNWVTAEPNKKLTCKHHKTSGPIIVGPTPTN